jgi:hypothetical protein
VSSRLSPFVRFGLAVFTLALGAYDLAECAVGTLADQYLPAVRRGVQISVGVVLVVLGSAS